MRAAVCPVCGDEFVKRRASSTYCSRECATKGAKTTLRLGEDKRRARAKTLTDAEFEGAYKRIRADLDSKPAQPQDRHWRRGGIAERAGRAEVIGDR